MCIFLILNFKDHHQSYDENDIRDIIDMGIAEVKQSKSKEKHGGRNDNTARPGRQGIRQAI